jgi:hypothetical protein
MYVANYSQLAKDYSTPGKITAKLGRNLSFVRGVDTITDIA